MSMLKLYRFSLFGIWDKVVGLFLVLSLSVSICQANTVPDDQEYEALMSLYNSAGGSGWSNHTNWGNTDIGFDQWHGVTTDNGDVVGLTLSSNNLTGSLPHQLGHLGELRTLDVRFNKLTGDISFISSLVHLTYLDFAYNQFLGSTPDVFRGLASLTYLDLASNQLSGDILRQLQSCSALQWLHIASNRFSGTIPPFYQSQWNSLIALDISYNDYSGGVPTTLAALPNLQHFKAQGNRLSGLIPELNNCWNLRFLNLSDNQLSGSVPQQLATLSNLEEFNVSNNELTTMPDFSRSSNPGILYADISYNHIGFGPLEVNYVNSTQLHVALLFYVGQTMPSGEDTETQSVAEPIVLTCSFSGAHNQYQWCKKNASNTWQPITGATAAVFRIGAPTMADAGSYACRVTNTWVRGMTLWTRTSTIVLTASTAYTPVNQPAADLNRNWTIERTYDGLDDAAANVLAESKQFTDGLGRATQAQARSRANPHVFASETIYSTGGQAVVQTLAAPIDNQSFAYKEKFVAVTIPAQSGNNTQPVGTANYSPINFEAGKADSPDPIDVQQRGTLGYYYSSANELEPFTPTTAYPFSLTEPAEGPLGGTKRAAAPGEAFRMGAGHEARGWEIPLLYEFDRYMMLRHHFVPGSNNQVTLKDQGTKSIRVDGDGRESVAVTNKEGQTLISCLTGTQYPAIDIQAFISTNPANTYDAGAPRFRDIHIPATGEHRMDFTVGGTVRVIDLTGGGGVSLSSGSGYADSVDVIVQRSTTASTPVYLVPGFYRLISRPSTDSVSYTHLTLPTIYSV